MVSGFDLLDVVYSLDVVYYFCFNLVLVVISCVYVYFFSTASLITCTTQHVTPRQPRITLSDDNDKLIFVCNHELPAVYSKEGY